MRGGFSSVWDFYTTDPAIFFGFFVTRLVGAGLGSRT